VPLFAGTKLFEQASFCRTAHGDMHSYVVRLLLAKNSNGTYYFVFLELVLSKRVEFLGDGPDGQISSKILGFNLFKENFEHYS
jgi:hypothetical protein